MEQEKNCEHELNISDEEWLSYEKLRVTLKCDICNRRFIGELEIDEM